MSECVFLPLRFATVPFGQYLFVVARPKFSAKISEEPGTHAWHVTALSFDIGNVEGQMHP